MLAVISTHGSSVDESLLTADHSALAAAAVPILKDLLNLINRVPSGKDSFFVACKDAAAQMSIAEEADPVETVPRASSFLRLIAINCGLLERRLNAPSDEEQLDLDAYIRDSFPVVGHAIKAIYDPSLAIDMPGFSREQDQDENSEAEKRATLAEERAKLTWAELDPQTFTFWRAGTTSIILKCERIGVAAATYKETLVLKCVLFPWNLIPAIAKSTQGYADAYKDVGPIVVRAMASTSRWVLMPFQEGPTLAEFMARSDEPKKGTGRRIALAREVALQLAAGLEALADDEVLAKVHEERQHLDLSPSNVIIDEGASKEEQWAVRFIDLGQNHLYTRQIGIAEHDDAVYVAPEVKNRGHSSTSDFFSLAVILIEALTGIKPRDGRVPDAVYEMSPLLGRLLDDMLDDESGKRLLLVPHVGDLKFCDITLHLSETFDLVSHEPVASESAFKQWYARWAPGSHEFWSLGGKLIGLIKEDGRKQLRKQLGYLTFMSSVAVAAWAYIFVRCAFFSFSGLLTGKPVTPPHGELLYASVIAFSQGMTASKYYQTILARLNLRGVAYPLAPLTEVGMRIMTVVALPTTIVAVAWRNDLWAWMCAFGALLVALTNLLTYCTAVTLSRRGARVFSTVPRTGRLVPGGYEQWWWTMLMYALVIALIAFGLQTGWMRDAPAYVIGLLVINFAIHYASKCVIAGPSVRGGLARAFTTGERLAALKKHEDAPQQKREDTPQPAAVS
jgi:serine/threonine protein kinase